MRKKILLGMTMILMVLALSSCAMLSSATLESMFRAESATQPTAGPMGDTIVISREEYEQYQKFSELYELIFGAEAYFYQEPDEQQMIDTAAKGLLAGLNDPYTFYYTPEEFTKMWEEDEGKYGGIGVLINANYNTQICTISRVFKGSPAEACGVQRGDILYRVGEELYVTADNLNDAVSIMRGTPGESVDVTFLRNGEEITFHITREIVNVNTIESTIVQDEIGYIALYEFSGESEKDFEKTLNDLLEKNIRGLIIDLRDNGGGWVEQARYIADLFMDKGILCYTVYRGDERIIEYMTEDGKTDIPLVILVNENSASSSEILTGALRECAGATVVGTKTFGKGIIQAVLPVGSRGAGYQITIAQYLTPNGNAVHQIGLTPDLVVERPEGDNGMYQFADTENDIQLQKAVEVMQEKLK